MFEQALITALLTSAFIVISLFVSVLIIYRLEKKKAQKRNERLKNDINEVINGISMDDVTKGGDK